MSDRSVTLVPKLLQSRIFLDPVILKVWIWCLFRANRRQVFYHDEVLQVGQFICGRAESSLELGLTVAQFRRATKKLADWGAIEKKNSHKFTVITVCNFSTYNERKIKKRQQKRHESASKSATRRATDLPPKKETPERSFVKDIESAGPPIDGSSEGIGVSAVASRAGSQTATAAATPAAPASRLTSMLPLMDSQPPQASPSQPVSPPGPAKAESCKTAPSWLIPLRGLLAEKPELVEAWSKWCRYYAEKHGHAIPPTQAEMTIQRLAEAGRHHQDWKPVVDVIQRSIVAGASRIFVDDLFNCANGRNAGRTLTVGEPRDFARENRK